MDRNYASKKIVRRLLGLPAKAPSPVPMRMEGNSIIFLEDKEKQAEIDAWVNEGWRGELADEISDWLRLPRLKARAENVKSSIENRVYTKRFYRSLKTTKTLTFESFYLHEPGVSWEIEGYITTDAGLSMSFSVIAAQGFADYIEQHYSDVHPRLNRAVSSETNIVLHASRHWVLRPGKAVDEADIVQAITDWYTDYYRYSRTSQVQRGKTPEVVVDISWEDNLNG